MLVISICFQWTEVNEWFFSVSLPILRKLDLSFCCWGHRVTKLSAADCLSALTGKEIEDVSRGYLGHSVSVLNRNHKKCFGRFKFRGRQDQVEKQWNLVIKWFFFYKTDCTVSFPLCIHECIFFLPFLSVIA